MRAFWETRWNPHKVSTPRSQDPRLQDSKTTQDPRSLLWFSPSPSPQTSATSQKPRTTHGRSQRRRRSSTASGPPSGRNPPGKPSSRRIFGSHGAGWVAGEWFLTPGWLDLKQGMRHGTWIRRINPLSGNPQTTHFQLPHNGSFPAYRTGKFLTRCGYFSQGTLLGVSLKGGQKEKHNCWVFIF